MQRELPHSTQFQKKNWFVYVLYVTSVPKERRAFQKMFCFVVFGPSLNRFTQTVPTKLVFHSFIHHFVDSGSSGDIFFLNYFFGFHGWKDLHPMTSLIAVFPSVKKLTKTEEIEKLENNMSPYFLCDVIQKNQQSSLTQIYDLNTVFLPKTSTVSFLASWRSCELAKDQREHDMLLLNAEIVLSYIP